MAFLTELDVINDMLATLGESPLNAVEDDHPMVASGVRILRVTSWREQAKGWWYNKELLTITPDSDGNLMTPADAISVDPISPILPYVQRGRRMYDPTTASFKFTLPVDCTLVRNIDFVDLPPSAAAYIAACAVMQFQTDYDADEAKARRLMANRNDALATLNAEHTRNMKVNLLTRPSMMTAFNVMGFRP